MPTTCPRSATCISTPVPGPRRKARGSRGPRRRRRISNKPQPFEALPAARRHRSIRRSAGSFSYPSANMSFARRADFSIGNGFFPEALGDARASTLGSDGPEPLYNSRSCQRCHPDGWPRASGRTGRRRGLDGAADLEAGRGSDRGDPGLSRHRARPGLWQPDPSFAAAPGWRRRMSMSPTSRCRWHWPAADGDPAPAGASRCAISPSAAPIRRRGISPRVARRR